MFHSGAVNDFPGVILSDFKVSSKFSAKDFSTSASSLFRVGVNPPRELLLFEENPVLLKLSCFLTCLLMALYPSVSFLTAPGLNFWALIWPISSICRWYSYFSSNFCQRSLWTILSLGIANLNTLNLFMVPGFIPWLSSLSSVSAVSLSSSDWFFFICISNWLI